MTTGNGWQQGAIYTSWDGLGIQVGFASFTIPEKPIWTHGFPNPTIEEFGWLGPWTGKQIPLYFPFLMNAGQTEIIQPIAQFDVGLGNWVVYCEYYKYPNIVITTTPQLVEVGQKIDVVMSGAFNGNPAQCTIIGMQNQSLVIEGADTMRHFGVAHEQFGTNHLEYFAGDMEFTDLGLIQDGQYVDPVHPDNGAQPMSEFVNYDNAGQDVDIVGARGGADVTLHTWM